MSSRAAAALVFVTSAAVLVIETLAGRLMAPYVGVTLETFTGIIGTILAGISLGAWLGGRAADRYDPGRLLGPLIAIGGALSLLSVPIVDMLGSGLRGADPVTIVTLTTLSFFAPAAVLSAVSPVIVKLRLADLEETGTIVGRLSAIGTAGAIVGTFVTGFVLVANFPTRPTMRGVAVALVVLGIALTVRAPGREERDEGVGTVTGPNLALAGAVALTLSLLSAGPCEYESTYFCAAIEVDPDRETGRTLRLDTLRHSYVDLEDPTYLEFTYAQTVEDVILTTLPPEDGPIDAVHVGGGGFTFPAYLRAVYPEGTTSTVLELDPLLYELAVDELGFEPGPDVAVEVGDARLTLEAVPTDAADLVIGDAFGGVSVPWHLTTQEFADEVHRVLHDDGVYVVNMIDYGPRDFARSFLATLEREFAHVAAFAPAERLGPRDEPAGGNFVLVASDRPIPVEAILARNAMPDEEAPTGDDEAAIANTGATAEAFDSFVGDATVLLDDDAPVDQLLTPLPTN
jgi:spermidine synthase